MIRADRPLAERLAELIAPSTAIVCIGNEMRGDDAAGAAAADRLAGTVPWKVYDVASAPESYLMKIVAARPESVLVIDAISFGAAPGSVAVFAEDELTGQGPSTHGPAPVAFLDALAMLHPCRCAVVGIQPARLDLDQPLSEPVSRAVEMIVEAFHELAADRTALE